MLDQQHGDVLSSLTDSIDEVKDTSEKVADAVNTAGEVMADGKEAMTSVVKTSTIGVTTVMGIITELKEMFEKVV